MQIAVRDSCREEEEEEGRFIHGVRRKNMIDGDPLIPQKGIRESEL